MKTYFLALFASVILSQTVMWEERTLLTEVDTTPDFKDSNKRGMLVYWGIAKFHYEGTAGEYDLNFLLMGGKVGLGISIRTGENILEDGNIVMQWYSHEDPDSPGK